MTSVDLTTPAGLDALITDDDATDGQVATYDAAQGKYVPANGAATRDVRALGARGLICFTWDDGYPMWDAIADKADQLGQKHTFAVTTNRIGTGDGITGGNASIIDWHNRGHEIANHTVTHASGAPAAEVDAAKVTLEALVGAGQVTTLVYPYGNRSAGIDQGHYCRVDRVVDYQSAAPVAMKDRYGVFEIPRVKGTPTGMPAYVKLAATQPVVIVFANHAPGGTDLGGAADPVSLAQAFAAMQLAHDLNVPCVTMAEAFPGGSMLMNPSFEDTTTGGVEWMMFGGGMSFATVTPDTGLAGTKALSIAIGDTTGSAGRQIINVEPGRSYTLSGRAKLSAGTLSTGHIRARIIRSADYAGPLYSLPNFNSAGTELATTADVTTTIWSRFSVTAVAPADCRFMEVQLVVEGQAGITGQFDHIDFRPTSLGAFG